MTKSAKARMVDVINKDNLTRALCATTRNGRHIQENNEELLTVLVVSTTEDSVAVVQYFSRKGNMIVLGATEAPYGYMNTLDNGHVSFEEENLAIASEE